MNGLKYLLFVKEMPLKEVAKHLQVTPQLIAAWSNGVQRIPTGKLCALSEFFQVDTSLIGKELTLNDKILIECQLESKALEQELGDVATLYTQLKSLQKQLKDYEHRVGSYQLQNQQLRHQLDEMRTTLHSFVDLI